MSYFRVDENCNGCLACVENCPARALATRDEGDTRIIMHSMTRCARCGTCFRVCPRRAVQFEHLIEGGWDHVITLEIARCTECGRPVHTARLGRDVDPSFASLVEPLCDEHRARRAAFDRARLATGIKVLLPGREP